MAVSQIQICNRALYKLGAARITSLGDDVKASRALADVYDSVLDGELAKYRWAFAMKRAILPALVPAPAFGFQRQFQLPSDYIRLDMVGDYYCTSDLTDYRTSPSALYVIEGGKILTNLPAPLHVRYVSRVTDSTQYVSPFVELMASRLAAELAEDLTQSSQKKQLAQADYMAALKDARRLGAIETESEKLPDSEWVVGRL